MNETLYIQFETIEQKIKKFTEWELMKANDKKIKTIMYKSKDKQIKCDVIGYLSKKTNTTYIDKKNIGCINPVYESVVIVVDGVKHRISIDFLKDMQKISKKV